MGYKVYRVYRVYRVCGLYRVYRVYGTYGVERENGVKVVWNGEVVREVGGV